MKKLISVGICLLMILSTTFCLTACKSRTDEMADLETYTTKQMNKTKKLLAALGILFFNIFGLIAFIILLIRSKKRK